MKLSSGSGRADPRRAFSLVEMLMVVAIISILAAISVSQYWGALDGSELKFVMPKLEKHLINLQKCAQSEGSVFVLEFPEGATFIRITERAEGEVETSEYDLNENGLLKRGLIFADYEWPDTTESPRTFTILPEGPIQGGSVEFGSRFAMAELTVKNGRPQWNMK